MKKKNSIGINIKIEYFTKYVKLHNLNLVLRKLFFTINWKKMYFATNLQP